MYPRVDSRPDFRYPAERLLKLQGILSADDIRTPDNKDLDDEPMRYVIKRGLTSLTTVGCLTGFASHSRRYSGLGQLDSVEEIVHSYDPSHCPFSTEGDSGSIIVDAFGKFAALLTSGTGTTDFSDITFGSPMYWLWEVIESQFPGANLYFEGDNN